MISALGSFYGEGGKFTGGEHPRLNAAGEGILNQAGEHFFDMHGRFLLLSVIRLGGKLNK